MGTVGSFDMAEGGGMSLPAYAPGEPCPCGIEGCVGSKLSFKTGHVVRDCKCRPCLGRRSKQKGQRNQSKVLKAAARAQGIDLRVAPTHEEHMRLLVHYEVKSGEQTRTASAKTLLDWEKQSRLFAERQTPIRKWAVVAVFPDGKKRIWMDFAQWLDLVAEITEAV